MQIPLFGGKKNLSREKEELDRRGTNDSKLFPDFSFFSIQGHGLPPSLPPRHQMNFSEQITRRRLGVAVAVAVARRGFSPFSGLRARKAFGRVVGVE